MCETFMQFMQNGFNEVLPLGFFFTHSPHRSHLRANYNKCPVGQFALQHEDGLLWFSAGLLLQNKMPEREVKKKIMIFFFIHLSHMNIFDSERSIFFYYILYFYILFLSISHFSLHLQAL